MFEGTFNLQSQTLHEATKEVHTHTHTHTHIYMPTYIDT